MEQITIRRIYNSTGDFSHIELEQGGNIIKLSFARTDLDSGKHSYKWEELKDLIDKHQLAVRKETE